jgi:hypothetical protein
MVSATNSLFTSVGGVMVPTTKTFEEMWRKQTQATDIVAYLQNQIEFDIRPISGTNANAYGTMGAI